MTIDTQEALRLLDELRHAGQCAAMYESDGRNGHARKEWERYDAAEKQLRALLSTPDCTASDDTPSKSRAKRVAVLSAKEREPSGWNPIESAPRGNLLLYFPPDVGRNAKNEMVRCDFYPVIYPRKPTHWQHIPASPTALRDAEKEKGNG